MTRPWNGNPETAPDVDEDEPSAEDLTDYEAIRNDADQRIVDDREEDEAAMVDASRSGMGA